MQCNQSFCGTGLPNCGHLTSYSQIPNCSQFPNYCQYPNYTQAPNCSQFSPCNPALQYNGASYPEIVGEGEVISLMLPDGSMKLYFQPTIKWCVPSAQNPNDVRYNNINNTAWFVRNISSLNLFNNIGNAVPQPVFNQSQSPYLGPPLPRPCFGCNSSIALPVQTVPPCQLKFHNDGWTSTTDLAYFYPRVRKSDVVSKSCAGVQVSSPTATAETYKSSHCDVVCPKPCDCPKICYQEMKAPARSSSYRDTRSQNPFSEYHSKTREKDVANSQSYMSIDEAKPKRKLSHKIKTKKKTNVCECSSHPQKGIVIASSQSGTSVEDTKSKDRIDKKAMKEKFKEEKRKKKEQSQKSLCPCSSPTAASTSSLTSSERKKLKLEKKEKEERKRKRDRKSSSQSESKYNNQSDTGTYIKTEEPKKKKIKLEKKEKKERKCELDCKCSSQSVSKDTKSDTGTYTETEEPKKMRLLDFSRPRTKYEKKSNDKKGKVSYEQDKSIDDSLVSLCTCCSTTTSTNSRTSNEKKQRRKREKREKKDKKLKHVHEHTSAGSNKPERKIKATKKTHVHEYHSSLKSKESINCMGNKASNISLVKKAVYEKSSQKIKTKKKAKEPRIDVCECSSHPQKGIVNASSQSGASVEDTESIDRITKKSKKEKVKKEKRKKKEQSQESLCPCCSSTTASISSLTCSEKKKLKLEKKEKNERKIKPDRKCSSQSESKNTQSGSGTDNTTKEQKKKKIMLENKKKKERNNKIDCKCSSQSGSKDTQSDTGTYIKTKEPKKRIIKLENTKERNNKIDCKCFSQSASKDTQSNTGTEEPKKMRLLDFSRSRTKHEKKSNESDAASSMCVAEKKSKSCEYLTAGSSEKHKKKLKKDTNEKKTKQYISIDDSLVSLCSCCSTATRTNSQTSNEKKHKPKREKKVKKDKKSKHVQDSDFYICDRASNSCLVQQAMKENVSVCDKQLDTFIKQVATYIDQDTSYTDRIACGSQTTCEKPIIKNPMLKCFPEINYNCEIPCIDLTTRFNDTNSKVTQAEIWFTKTPKSKKASETESSMFL